jgi:hypothetical protein
MPTVVDGRANEASIGPADDETAIVVQRVSLSAWRELSVLSFQCVPVGRSRPGPDLDRARPSARAASRSSQNLEKSRTLSLWTSKRGRRTLSRFPPKLSEQSKQWQKQAGSKEAEQRSTCHATVHSAGQIH